MVYESKHKSHYMEVGKKIYVGIHVEKKKRIENFLNAQ